MSANIGIFLQEIFFAILILNTQQLYSPSNRIEHFLMIWPQCVPPPAVQRYIFAGRPWSMIGECLWILELIRFTISCAYISTQLLNNCFVAVVVVDDDDGYFSPSNQTRVWCEKKFNSRQLSSNYVLILQEPFGSLVPKFNNCFRHWEEKLIYVHVAFFQESKSTFIISIENSNPISVQGTRRAPRLRTWKELVI